MDSCVLLAATCFLVVCLLLPACMVAQAQPANSSCDDCHSSFPAPTGVAAEQWAADIHAQKGLTCASCHGGDPKDASPEGAMSKKAGFRGKPKRTEIPAMCAKCHADGAYMRQYNPSLRTDQLALYQTSVHGKRLALGDTKVAVCIDCHSVHGIRPAKDPRSTVNPLNVANTCARCHANAAYMKDYKINTDQFAGYSASVHHDAMVVRGDLSAPTCSTCHGNHGAAPPGVASVENVCSTCHVFQAQLFDTSRHKAAFAAMGTGSCITCHGNHRIIRPTDNLVGTGSDAICTNCHASGDPGFTAAGRIHSDLTKLDEALKRSDEVLDKAERSGMEVSQARLDETQGRDSLIKARVTVHSFQPDKVEQDTQAGMKIADKTYTAGLSALAERDYRRKGLGLTLIAIVAVLIGLRMYIRQVESRGGS